MTTTQQPIWKYAGHIGDIDPIAYGGGYIYTDETGVYAPEMTYFEPGPDEEWDKVGGQTKLKVYRIMLEKDSTREWWYGKLDAIASYTGQTQFKVEAAAVGDDILALAQLYSDLISYHGADNFDSYPDTCTEDEAYAKFAEEMRVSRGR